MKQNALIPPQPQAIAVTFSPPETRASLIQRLPNAADVAAWDEVMAIYGPLVYRLARRKGLQPADADDLVQVVLSNVSQSVEKWLERTDRGPFRGWLLSIARNTAINFLTRPTHRPWSAGGSGAAQQLAQTAISPEDSSQFDLQYRREKFRWAASQVRQTVSPTTWQAFWESTIEQRDIAEVARQLDMTIGSVYIARSRIMARLRQLVRQAEGDSS